MDIPPNNKMNKGFVQGDILLPTLEINKFVDNNPILLLSDQCSEEAGDMNCLSIGMTGNFIRFWHNPEVAKPYDGDKESIRYKTLQAISSYILGEIDREELARKIGSIQAKPLISMLDDYYFFEHPKDEID